MADRANNTARHDVERIVREVLAQLTAPRAEVKPSPGGELIVTNKVVSLAEVEKRLGGVVRLVVPRGAVITPAARDELRKYKVAIASAVPAVERKNLRKLMVGVEKTHYDPTALLKALTGEGVAIQRIAETNLVNAVDQLCGHVTAGGRIGLLLTDRTAAAVCLANRVSGVRAAVGSSPAATSEAARTMGVNLLAVDPGGKGVFETRQIVRELIRAAAECPADLRERLG